MTMKFMMLIHHDEEALAAAPQRELWADFGAFNHALAKAGRGFTPGARLQASKGATTVRGRVGKKNGPRGPYTDTQEQFARHLPLAAAGPDPPLDRAQR